MNLGELLLTNSVGFCFSSCTISVVLSFFSPFFSISKGVSLFSSCVSIPFILTLSKLNCQDFHLPIDNLFTISYHLYSLSISHVPLKVRPGGIAKEGSRYWTLAFEGM